MTSQTPGQALTAALRTRLHIGSRTRRYRRSHDLFAAALAAIRRADMEDVLAPGYPVLWSWEMHVEGGRVDIEQRAYLTTLTAWDFTAILGDMIDAGVSSIGEGERYFADRAEADRQAWRNRPAP
ncbi:hypothetical protein AB0395_48300 [Streptosporangium sp. NPDC051023]|uniref:hypothetical protein n=1 Tax=Streptosporangium sp. NPDC051023 TaxID=3155410 RepID=UPI00344C1EA1